MDAKELFIQENGETKSSGIWTAGNAEMIKIEIRRSSVSKLINNLYEPKYKILGDLGPFSDNFPMGYRLNKLNLYLLSIRIRGIP